MLEYSIHYTDIFYFSQLVSQIEKIKFLLFDKTELAIFSQKIFDNPLKKSNDKMTEFYKLSQNMKGLNNEMINNNALRKKSINFDNKL